MHFRNIFNLVDKLLLEPDIQTSDIAVFFSLIMRMGNKGYCYPAVDTLEQETKYSRRSVQNSTKRLEEIGYINKIYRKTGRKQYSNVYALTQRSEEVVKISKGDGLKQLILEDQEFLEFINKKNRTKIDDHYKIKALIFCMRKLNIDKIEKVFLMYAILSADREAFFYFQPHTVAKKLNMAQSRLDKIFLALANEGLIHIMSKIVSGKAICLVHLNLALLGQRKIIAKKHDMLLELKYRRNIKALYCFYKVVTIEKRSIKGMKEGEKIHTVRYSVEILVIRYNMLYRHALFDKVFAP